MSLYQEAKNPSTPPKRLRELLLVSPWGVLRNPALPLLELEDPGLRREAEIELSNQRIYKWLNKAPGAVCLRFAIECAERVLPIFEAARPGDLRPYEAIQIARERQGRIGLKDRQEEDLFFSYSEAAHKAAGDLRRTEGDIPAVHAARAAAFCAWAIVWGDAGNDAYFAAKQAVLAAPAPDSELAWQVTRLRELLREAAL